MTEPKIVLVLDADGLLIRSFKPHLATVNYILKEYNLPQISGVEYRRLNKDYRLFYREAGIKDSIKELTKIYCPVFNVLIREEKPPLVPYAKETLCFLSNNVSLCLLTNQNRENIEFYDSYNNFLIYFKKIFYVECPLSKEQVLCEIKNNWPDSENRIFIFCSDSPDDLIAGQNAGFKVYGIAEYGFSSPENLKEAISHGNGDLLLNILELKEMLLPLTDDKI